MNEFHPLRDETADLPLWLPFAGDTESGGAEPAPAPETIFRASFASYRHRAFPCYLLKLHFAQGGWAWWIRYERSDGPPIQHELREPCEGEPSESLLRSASDHAAYLHRMRDRKQSEL